jgi:hypothetical protein
LERLREVVERDHPTFVHNIPQPEGIDITKLGKDGLIMTDSCNAAQKARRLLKYKIGGNVHELDCFHHLRNVWIKGAEKAVSASLRILLADSLENIPADLRVSCIFSALARAWDKFFSLCANYPKGQGEHFAAWLKVHNPDTPLHHVVGAQGSRHDLCLMAAPAIYMNRHVCFEYADYLLRLPKKQDNILLRCLFVLMTSEEIIAQSRLFSILYISFCLPMRWLAAKTPELQEWEWGPISNGGAIDTLRLKMMDLVKDPTNILEEDFMMGMFSEYINKFPPFKKYWEHLFNKKQMIVVASESGAKVLPYADLRKELFHPSDSTNAATNSRLVELAPVVAQAILDELHDQKKATYKYLSISGSEYSVLGCPPDVQKALRGLEATNDMSESALGGATQQIQQFGRISIPNAAAVSDARRNQYSQRFTKNDKDRRHSSGMFYQFPSEVRESLLIVALEDAPKAVSTNREHLDNQREAKRRKEEMMEQKNMLKAQESTIEASYYWDMYRSDVCWKNTKTLTKMLARLKSETAKIEALKENIRMRVIGCGWTQFATTWSHQGKKKSVDELKNHPKWIIKEEKKLTVPSDPFIELPTRAELPVLGTATQQLIDSNNTAQIDEEQFRKDAQEMRQQREDRGEGSIFSVLQPLVCPEPDELLDKRIDVLYSFQLTSDGDRALRWCQGKVIEVITDRRVPTVSVCWDPMPDVEGKEDVSEVTEQVVPPRKFNKDVEGAWRLDINVSIQADNGDTHDKESDMAYNDGSCTSSDCSDGSSSGESDSELDNIHSNSD